VTARADADLLLAWELLTEEERAVRERVRAFCVERVAPDAAARWERAELPRHLFQDLARLGVVGGTIAGHGCPGLTPTAAGLVDLELARADGSLFTFLGSHAGLAMGAIALLGSEAQRERWLPPMARLERIGAFALTEPDHGSDATDLATRARAAEGGGYRIDGAKRWIGNGTVADVLVVWARGDDGEIGGYLVQGDAPGLSARLIEGKSALRAVWQADLAFEDVRVPEEARLPGARRFADVSRVLAGTRAAVAWQSLGHAIACFELAVAHVDAREQFGAPLAAFQLVQERLARMAAEVVCMQLMCLRLGRLAADGRLTVPMASLAKMHCAQAARRVASAARDLLGGEGILLERGVARHLADLEAVVTYEGTDFVNALIVGREITGRSAFRPPGRA
jgi:glutaryl-CoA dehydrogenase